MGEFHLPNTDGLAFVVCRYDRFGYIASLETFYLMMIQQPILHRMHIHLHPDAYFLCYYEDADVSDLNVIIL